MSTKPAEYYVTPQIPVVNTMACIRCGLCMMTCPNSAISKAPNPSCSKCVGYCLTMPVNCYRDNIVIDENLCDACGNCLDVCPFHAITFDRNPINN